MDGKGDANSEREPDERYLVVDFRLLIIDLQ